MNNEKSSSQLIIISEKMAKKRDSNLEISYKDLTKSELEDLKDLYVASRLSQMSNIDLRSFVKAVLEDQIKGTVGNEEEKEAWVEMKDHFQDDFEIKIKSVKREGVEDELASPEEREFSKRLELLGKQEKEEENKDMW